MLNLRTPQLRWSRAIADCGSRVMRAAWRREILRHSYLERCCARYSSRSPKRQMRNGGRARVRVTATPFRRGSNHAMLLIVEV